MRDKLAALGNFLEPWPELASFAKKVVIWIDHEQGGSGGVIDSIHGQLLV